LCVWFESLGFYSHLDEVLKAEFHDIATFAWSAGTGATAYWLDIGSTLGGNDYYQSGNLGNVLTTTVYSLPADGSQIYVTLYSLVGGQWFSNAYTYTSGP